VAACEKRLRDQQGTPSSLALIHESHSGCSADKAVVYPCRISDLFHVFALLMRSGKVLLVGEEVADHSKQEDGEVGCEPEHRMVPSSGRIC